MRPADLLTALVPVYWKGGVTQEQAAQLVGIRKSEFADYANGLMLLTIIDNATWRYYLQAFHVVFPECDQRTVRAETRPGLLADPLWRRGPAAPATTYTAIEAEALPASQPNLPTWIGLTGTENDPIVRKWKPENQCRPPTDSRKRLRVSEPQQFDEPGVLIDGPEFEFTEAA